MTRLEIAFFWITIFAYIGAFCLTAGSVMKSGERLEKIARVVLYSALAAHTATCIVRWAGAGHPPVTDTYELNLIGTWFTMVLFSLFERGGRVSLGVALPMIPITFLILGHGFVLRSEAVPLGPAYRSPWLVVHVIFAWLAFGSYAIASGAAAVLLLKLYFPSLRPLPRMPAAAALDAVCYRFVVFGFVNHAVMIASGAIWAKNLWGRYWGWDALETWSLIAFLTYAAYLHTRSFLGWRMQRAAWLATAALFVLVVSFWGVGWFGPTVHPGP